MTKRLVLAGVLAGIAMYLWTFVAHMALPLGEAGVKQIDHEEALLPQMRATLSAPGFYMFPNMPPGEDQAVYQKKIAAGPSGLLVYFPSRDFNFGKLLGVEFAVELIQAMLAVWLLSLTRISSFAGRVGFFVLAGLMASLATNVSYWNWYGFPPVYTAAYIFTGWMGYVCAGLVAAAFKVGGDRAAAIPVRMAA